MVSTSLKDLTTTGYVLIKNYLTTEEVKSLVNCYTDLVESHNRNYFLAIAPRDKLTDISPKIINTLKEIGIETDIIVDMMLPIAMYADTSKFSTAWHQDHESYFYFQQHYNYLNFYIILKKEDPTRSGLSVVPFDKLKDCTNFDKILGSGAKLFFPGKAGTVVTSQETEEIFNLPININDIATTPDLEVGDLLLLRGDIIHRTQDSDTHRLALSIRCTKSNSLIKLEPLENLNRSKQKYIDNDFQSFQNLKFKLEQKGSITAEEAINFDYIAKIS